jgi:hypothetical protein
MLYGSAIDRRIEQSTSVAEMRMLRWMSGETREDRMRRDCIGVLLIVDKMRENRLRRLGCVMRQEETKSIRVVMKINVKGKKWLKMIIKHVGVHRGCRKLRHVEF